MGSLSFSIPELLMFGQMLRDDGFMRASESANTATGRPVMKEKRTTQKTSAASSDRRGGHQAAAAKKKKVHHILCPIIEDAAEELAALPEVSNHAIKASST